MDISSIRISIGTLGRNKSVIKIVNYEKWSIRNQILIPGKQDENCLLIFQDLAFPAIMRAAPAIAESLMTIDIAV